MHICKDNELYTPNINNQIKIKDEIFNLIDENDNFVILRKYITKLTM